MARTRTAAARPRKMLYKACEAGGKVNVAANKDRESAPRRYVAAVDAARTDNCDVIDVIHPQVSFPFTERAACETA